VCVEEELEIDAERFARLWPADRGAAAREGPSCDPGGRRSRAGGGQSAGELEGLVTADVEFASERDAVAFEPLSWFGLEVTEDPPYKNRWLARRGLPSGAAVSIRGLPGEN
jgi:hypothetical protein